MSLDQAAAKTSSLGESGSTEPLHVAPRPPIEEEEPHPCARGAAAASSWHEQHRSFWAQRRSSYVLILHHSESPKPEGFVETEVDGEGRSASLEGVESMQRH